MTFRKSVFISILFSFCILQSAKLSAKDNTIVWAKNDAPPFYILSGEYQGKGFGDLIQDMIMEKMDDYKHAIVHMPLSRINDAWANNESICMSTLIYGSEPPGVILSIPNIFYLSPGIIIKRDLADSLSLGDTISFSAFLENYKLRFGKTAKRNYGKVIDDILEKNSENIDAISRFGNDETIGQFNMLLGNRFDFTIDYIYTLMYYNNYIDRTGRLKFIEISELDDSGIVGAIGCTDNPEGRQFINDINIAIKKVLNTEAYKNILEKYLIPEGRAEFYWEKYGREVLSDVPIR